jgi:hypothetical protein
MGAIFKLPEPMTGAWADKTFGMIFEFKDLEKAKAFATEVWEKYNLGGRVFDNAEDAEHAHVFPWVQEPPVAHIDRACTPSWLSPGMYKIIQGMARNLEDKIEKLAEQFGGKYIGN